MVIAKWRCAFRGHLGSAVTRQSPVALEQNRAFLRKGATLEATSDILSCASASIFANSLVRHVSKCSNFGLPDYFRIGTHCNLESYVMFSVPLRCMCCCDCCSSQNYCHIEFLSFLLHNGLFQFYISSYFLMDGKFVPICYP